jgi:hypothetical protein
VTVLAGLDNPSAGVIRDSAGNLYGTSQRSQTGAGFVFKVDTQGNFTELYSFAGGTDGGGPLGGLYRDSAGNLYGTAFYGGRNGSGVVFKLQ